MKYDLGKLAPRKRGVVTLPSPIAGRGAEISYLRQIRIVLRAMAQHVSLYVLPAVSREIDVRRQQDAATDYYTALKLLGEALTRSIMPTVIEIFKLEARRHTRGFLAAARRHLGVDLSAVVREEDLEELIDLAASRNAALITNITSELAGRIQQTVVQSVLTGSSSKSLKQKLVADFGFADVRAKLVAQDQTAKLTSDITRFRHEQAGIEKYIWRTSRDERVRSRHKKLDGKVYAYGEPTGAEQGLPPGQPIRCRCVALAIVEF